MKDEEGKGDPKVVRYGDAGKMALGTLGEEETRAE